MSYRNKTYVIFDGDNDIRYYQLMRGWKQHDHLDFNFHDAHDLRPLTARASEDTVRSRLRSRLSNTKQSLVLIGESTKNLYKFVRWEIDTCLSLDIPIVAVNLNGKRTMDPQLCPAILRDKYVVHVPFKLAIIRYALDNFPSEYVARDKSAGGNRYYNDSIYRRLGI
jgi:hypothetical protein